jgi:multimeric flavodoxin WrbA
MASRKHGPRLPVVRTGQGSVALEKDAFRERWLARFYDPAFEAESDALERLVEIAWEAYQGDRKSPRTRRAGRGFADPDAQLPVEWLAARDAIRAAQKRQRAADGPSRILLVCAAARSDQTCPGEMSKTFRMTRWVREVVEAEPGFEVDVLDLSRLASEYGRAILPCKACVATAMPLCHWPCSCYPNHGQGQVGDWMNEIYPRWVAAHGVAIVSPVYWYQAPSPLKLMMDRLVCADGGNPDPTTTDGKDPAKAKALELAGWDYPRHLSGRAFSVVVHGDAAGAEELRRILVDWLTDMELVPAGPAPGLDRYVGYYEPYATSHEALDRDAALRGEVENVARTLVERVRQIRSGAYVRPDAGLTKPRPK